jgi:hypothetical protein
MVSSQLVPGAITTGNYIDTNFTAYNLVSSQVSTSFNISLGVAQNQTTDLESWKSALISLTATASEEPQTDSLNWWHSFWDRSYIIINPDSPTSDPGFQVGKNYQYFRYMMGCNAFGEWPTRFNGGLFTFDPSLSGGGNYTPDFRKWSGGTFTAQNQRLLSWPLLKSGDFDIMKGKLSIHFIRFTYIL